jgi:hypothetical protein
LYQTLENQLFHLISKLRVPLSLKGTIELALADAEVQVILVFEILTPDSQDCSN